ncbi:MAG: lipoprotein signal peptidase [Bacteroidota bacterium]|nr:lipoprotein signal peptidase [Bacteroidota bacterium]
MAKPSKVWKAFVLIAIILVVDQAVKIYIKTHFQLHESFRVTNWFYIYFTENSGMAFGWEFFDKIFLTLFRIIAAGLLIWYMVHISRKKQFPTGYVLSIALIIAGALGNVIDCVFYGLIFDHSYGQVAGFFPEGGGYAPIFYGKVVDMLFFPLIDTTLPDWLPIWGGRHFLFFRPVFNIADTSITTGILILLIFYRSCLAEDTKGEKSKSDKAGSPLTT